MSNTSSIIKYKLTFKLHSVTYIPKRIREAVPRSGPADDAIEFLRSFVSVDVSLEDSIAYLKSTGGWEEHELQDLDSNSERLLWLACLECQKNKTS